MKSRDLKKKVLGFVVGVAISIVSLVATPIVFAGHEHWAYASTPQEAAKIANTEARRRAKRIRTCVTTYAIPGTPTCKVGGPKGWMCYAVSADHKSSC